MRRLCLITALASVIVLSTIGIAYAHVVYEHGTMWQDNNGHCVKLYTEISDGDASHGYIRTTVWAYNKAWTPYGQRDCIAAWDQPAGRIREKSILWKYTESNGWAVCDDFGGGRRNTSEGFRLNYSKNLGACGDGWHGVTAGGQVYISEGLDGSARWVPVWQDAVLYSGSHWLEG